MTTPELLEFIRIEHALGMSFNEIIQLLTGEGGWDREDVFEAFRALGLPEEAVESFFAKDKIKTVKEEVKAAVVDKKVEEKIATTSPPPRDISKNIEKNNSIIQHAPESTPAPAPQNIKQVMHAAPMHYVEEPVKKDKPTLARPASLTGQASRPLVRTLSTASTYAKVDPSRDHSHDGALIHVSKLQSGHSAVSHAEKSYPSEESLLSREVRAEEKIEEIERSLSFGIDIPKDEPKPKSVVSPSRIVDDKKENIFKGLRVSSGGELKEINSNLEDTEDIVPRPIFTLPAHSTEAVISEVKKAEEIKLPEPIAPAPIDHKQEIINTLVKAPVFTPPVPPIEAVIPEEVKVPETKKIIEQTSPIQEIKLPEPIAPVPEIPKQEILNTPVPKPVFTPPTPKVEVVVPEIKNVEEVKNIEIVKPIEKERPSDELKLPNPIAHIPDIPKTEPIIAPPSIPVSAPPAPKVEEVVPEVKKIEEVKTEEIVKPVEAPKTIEEAKVVETPKPVEEQKPIEEVKVDNTPKVEPPKEVAPTPVFTPPLPQYVQPPPQYIQLPPQQIYVMPSQQMYGQPMAPQGYPPQMPPGMMQGQPPPMGQYPHTAEIGSTAPDLEEQAYLAQFGQAKMPEGLVRPQASMVAPTIIYAQMAAPSIPAEYKAVEKKPEPIRFDIGRVRTAHKTDQTSYSGRPSLIAAVNGMLPVESKSMEDIFKSKANDDDLSFKSMENKDALRSIKVPHKRTMASDLINVQEGVLPSQVVTQLTNEGVVSGSNMPNTAAAVVDEEPIPPPPPKKSTKSILIISLVIFILFAIGAAAAYYFVVLRLPSADEVYKTTLGITTRGPALSYDATLSIHAKSTDAEPENINVDLYASGTLEISSKAFEDGNHELKFKVEHTGVPGPLNFDFDGNVSVLDDILMVSQKTPSHGTKIENILNEGERIKFSYKDIGKMLSLTSDKSIPFGDYGQVNPGISLFKLAINNSPITVAGEITKFKKDGRDYYKLPVKLDPKRMIVDGDLLGKYLKGAESIASNSERSAILQARYEQISGEVIIDKLLMSPVSITLSGKFDPSKIPLDGDMKLVINLSFSNQVPKVTTEAKTYDEIMSLRADSSASNEIIKRDAPYMAIAPVIELAIRQYYEKIGRYPIALDDLISSGFIGKEAITPEMKENIFYSSYVSKPDSLVSGVRCVAKNNKCNFYHLGINIQYKNIPELQRDADIDTSIISGGDNSGCHNEVGFACLDIYGDNSVNTKSPLP